MQKPLALTYLTLEAPRDGQAAYTHIHEIINGLKRRGWTVSLYQPSYVRKPISPSLVARVFHALALQFKLWIEFKRGDILYIRAHYLALPTVLIAKILGIPVVQEVNGPYEDVFVTYPVLNRVKSLMIKAMRAQYKLGTLLIGVTENIAGWLNAETGRTDAIVIPNGANTDLFRTDVIKRSDLPDRYVIFFGGLSRWHGIPTILEAFKSVLWPQDLSLVFIGDGPERELIEDYARTHKNILYLGKKDYREIPAYIASALCGLVPITNPQGRSETGLYPLKLFETLACGVPVVVTDFPGQAELVRDANCGLVIDADNAEQLATAVKFFNDDTVAAKAMGERGAMLVKTHHSWDARAQDTHEALCRLKA